MAHDDDQGDRRPAPLAVIGTDFVLWTAGVGIFTAITMVGGLRWLWIGVLGWGGVTVTSRRASWWIARRLGWVRPGGPSRD